MMKPYDERAKCPKCGCALVQTHHQNMYGSSLMIRRCERCKHTWEELPLDAVPRHGTDES